MLDKESIKKDGVKLIDEFSKMLENIPESKETHYVMDVKNVWRKDGEPVKTKDFRKKISKNAPKMEEGYVVAEKVV